jgi:hypothetical protein
MGCIRGRSLVGLRRLRSAQSRIRSRAAPRCRRRSVHSRQAREGLPEAPRLIGIEPIFKLRKRDPALNQPSRVQLPSIRDDCVPPLQHVCDQPYLITRKSRWVRTTTIGSSTYSVAPSLSPVSPLVRRTKSVSAWLYHPGRSSWSSPLLSFTWFDDRAMVWSSSSSCFSDRPRFTVAAPFAAAPPIDPAP